MMLFLRINMFSDGLIDLMKMLMSVPFTINKTTKLDNIQTKAKERYLPVYEKVSSSSWSGQCLVFMYIYVHDN